MATINLSEVCNTIQQDLANIVGENYGAAQRQKTGFLDALVSPENTTMTEQIQTDAGDGKIKQVSVRYLSAGLASEVSQEPGDICEAGDEDSFKYELVKPTLYAETKITFSTAEMRKWCDSPAADRARVIATKMNRLFVDINEQLIAAANTNVGTFYNGVAAGKQVPMLFAASGSMVQANPAGEVTVLEDMSDLGIVGTPIVVGAGKLSQYARYANIGCCNEYGQDIASLGALAFYRDQFLGAITGNADDFLAFAPGAVQMIQWNANRGEFAMNLGTIERTTIIDPITGIELDLVVKYIECDDKWTFTFSKWFDLFNIPTDVFGEDDPREGVNNLFKYRAVCGAGSFCDAPVGEGEGEGEGEA
jgi:hypothetical protein